MRPGLTGGDPLDEFLACFWLVDVDWRDDGGRYLLEHKHPDVVPDPQVLAACPYRDARLGTALPINVAALRAVSGQWGAILAAVSGLGGALVEEVGGISLQQAFAVASAGASLGALRAETVDG